MTEKQKIARATKIQNEAYGKGVKMATKYTFNKKGNDLGIKDPISDIVSDLSQQLAEYYDRKLLESVFGKSGLIKYRSQRVPTYLQIKIPTIERHECYCDGELVERGWLITTRWVKLFRIGSHIEKVPYYPKHSVRFSMT